MGGLTGVRTMTDSQVQAWLGKLGYENAGKLGMALLDADEEVQKVVFRNMSGRAAGFLRDDIEKYKLSRPDEKVIAGCVTELETMF